MTTSRTDFNESWLSEMPTGIGPLSFQFFDSIVKNINDYIGHGITPVSLPNNYKKIIGQQVAFYWHENAQGEIDIAIELSIKPQALIVNGVGRKQSGSEVHASDLYHVILSDTDTSIRLMSDTQLSDQGFDLWKRLLKLGHNVSAYDSKNPSNGLIPLKTVTDLKRYFKKHDQDYKRYQYVISENSIKLAETHAYFNTRRLRELSGLDVKD